VRVWEKKKERVRKGFAGETTPLFPETGLGPEGIRRKHRLLGQRISARATQGQGEDSRFERKFDIAAEEAIWEGGWIGRCFQERAG